MEKDETLTKLNSFEPSYFQPAWWLPGGHLQTIGGWLFRHFSGINYSREKLELSDGDFLNLDIHPSDYKGREKEAYRAIAVLVHGLEGSSRSGYIQQLASRLAKKNILIVAMNLRSCGGEMNHKDRFYCAGDSDDLAEVVDWCSGSFPNTPFLAAGFSLGGALLLKYLGERKENTKLKAAAGVSIPLNLDLGMQQIETGFPRLYNKYFTHYLRQKGRRKLESGWYQLPVESLYELEDIRDFDERITAPLCGYDGARDYYSSCSANNFIPNIKTPTLLVQAHSDPLIAWDQSILNQIKTSRFTRLLELNEGGHMGFLSGKVPLYPHYWLEEELTRFLTEFC